jgi:DNA-binding response OmpR family regulator
MLTMAALRGRILVVDDTEPNLRLLRALLTGAGYEVITANCGAEGITAATRENPDLILLDIMMPDLTGFDVCQRLRAAAETRQTPIVFLTALHEMEDHVRAVDVGGDDVLTKPINKLELLLRVKSLLRVRELMGELEAQRHLIHDLLTSYVSAEAAARFLVDPASAASLQTLKAGP